MDDKGQFYLVYNIELAIRFLRFLLFDLNCYFSAESLLLRTIGLLFVAAIAGWTAAQTEKGGAFIDLCMEARVEIRKVVWPSRQETTQTTIVVLIVIFIVAIILWLLDSMLNGIISSFIT